MLDDKRVTQEDIDSVRVRLRPLFGIAPGRWLAALCSIVILLVIFLVLFLPGLKRNGSILTVVSRPGQAAVFLDGAYAGTSPCSIFVSRGSHRVTVSRPGFSALDRQLDVGGRVFGSLFAPRRISIAARLEAADPASLLEDAFAEYALWSLCGRPSAIYQIPLPLSEALLALGETGNSSYPPREEVPAFAASALAAAAGEHSARDALRAAFLAAAGGAPSPLGLVAGIEALEKGLGSNPAVLPWLESILPPSTRARLSAIAALGQSGPPAAGPATGLGGAAVETLGGLRFRAIPGGSFVASGESPGGSSLPYTVSLSSYALAETEVTRRQWSSFIAAKPEWGPGNRAALIASGRADGNYLADWGLLRPDEPVTGVSWEAARAYCEWLGGFASGGRAVVLPSEAMWERAALLGADAVAPGGDAKGRGPVFARAERRGPEPASGPGPGSGADRLGIRDLLGNVWEWCSDAYVPYPALLPAGSHWQTGERSVRGGSWADRQETVSVGSRGSFPPAFSSPFLGFRPALMDQRMDRR